MPATAIERPSSRRTSQTNSRRADRRAAQRTSQSPSSSGRPASRRSASGPGRRSIAHDHVPSQAWVVAPRTEERLDTASYWSVPALLVSVGYIVGAILAILFALDLAIGMPFSRASVVFDASALLCGTTLIYLSWDAWDAVR